MTNFGFLEQEWPELYESAARAEAMAWPDARTSCFYARRTLELAVNWVFIHDTTLSMPYEGHLAALLHEPTFKNAVGPEVSQKTLLIKGLGNQAVHSRKAITSEESVGAVRELFHVLWWLAHTYARRQRPAAGMCFNLDLLPRHEAAAPQTLAQVQKLEAELAARDALIARLEAARASATAELVTLRAVIAAAKQENAAHPPAAPHDYTEAETRELFIDLLLREAGWPLDERSKEVPVTGMPNPTGNGFVDYVLWGDDGRPLALVEAKRARRSPQEGQHQARLYADCLEKQYGQRPVIFYSNGYQHWLWDDLDAPPRPVAGFYKKDELERLVQRRSTALPLATATINPAIAERYYQTRAIRHVIATFEKKQRRALLVMATGAGKTRTAVALCDLLMRCNHTFRVLFLADRRELVRQAADAFKKHLPSSAPVNLCDSPDEEGRVSISTYPTMMGLINREVDGPGGNRVRRFGPGHFDLVIIDEAHRSIFRKYKALFDYFDARLLGLTATPRSEIDRNTYGVFGLEEGVPTDSYDLAEAVKDNYLVTYKSISARLKFPVQGIRYDELSEADRAQWEETDWEGDEPPAEVAAAAVNSWLFNIDTVDKALEFLMTRGMRVAGGDRLGKTILFARNQAHAEFISRRFDANYPEYMGTFARVIHNGIVQVENLIDSFKLPEKEPHIAISVDMLDTGVDIPEVVNLVFFKPVRSKTKFWQMVGRGTRLCKGLLGPGQDKEFFYIFDHCGNLEYFNLDLPEAPGSVAPTLGEKLFRTRLDLLAALDESENGDAARAGLRGKLAGRLQQEVAAMNVDNFQVRPQRALVERYAAPEAWQRMTAGERQEVARHLAALPSGLTGDDPEARQFDLLMLRIALGVLQGRDISTMREQVVKMAAQLAGKTAIPLVREQMELIAAVQTGSWWENVTAPVLEEARGRLRGLARLIEKEQRRPVYTDFEDEMAEPVQIALAPQTPGVNDGLFASKAGAYLRQHEEVPAIRKLRWNEPLTAADLKELACILTEAGCGGEVAPYAADPAEFVKFLRNLAGMNREAAQKAFSSFLEDKAMSANQIDFIHRIMDELSENGWIEPGRLFESPYTDLHPEGVSGMFDGRAPELIAIVNGIKSRAMAA